MGFKGIYKEKSSASKIGLLFLLIIFCLMLHTISAAFLISIFFDNSILITQNQDLTNQSSVNALKLMQLFNGLGIFVSPLLLYSYLTNYDFKFTRITRQNTMLVIAIMMFVTPFVTLLLEWNMKIPFPEWILRLDLNSEVIVKAFLNMNTSSDFLYTLIVIAFVPAIGEELFFRGYLQRTICNALSSPHTAIIITSALFSLIHLDMQAFFPRFFLGLLLGYLYYWSTNLWLPILAHFVNNAQVVVFNFSPFKLQSGEFSFFYQKNVEPVIGLFSLAAVMLLLYLLYQNLSIKKD